jgi:hypothetical protein
MWCVYGIYLASDIEYNDISVLTTMLKKNWHSAFQHSALKAYCYFHTILIVAVNQEQSRALSAIIPRKGAAVRNGRD